jgi:hypothetical protein
LFKQLYKLKEDGSDCPVHRAHEAVQQRLHQIGQEVHKARQKRIPEDCDRDRHRVRHHGLHRVLREANSHSHQQHHRRSITDNFSAKSLTKTCSVF